MKQPTRRYAKALIFSIVGLALSGLCTRLCLDRPTPRATPQSPSVVATPTAPQNEVPTAALAAFQEWAQTSEPQRQQTLSHGLALAQARRGVMKSLIISNPQRALQLEVPRVVRQTLPPEIIKELETPVSARGELEVLFAMPRDPSDLPEGFESVRRSFTTNNGTAYRARVYGEAVNHRGAREVAVRGIAIDGDLAVAASPVRTLELGELLDPSIPVTETCPVSGKSTALPPAEAAAPVSAETPTVELAGTYIRLCNGAHVQIFDEAEKHSFLMASGGSGGASPFRDSFPGSTGVLAIGNYRAIYIRVTYPDQMFAPNSEATAYEDMRNVQRYFLENSYGKLTLTSVVTPLLVLPQTKEWYIAKNVGQSGLSQVHTDSSAVARLAGYDTTQYDVIIVRVEGGPLLDGFSWGGGNRVWLTWDGMDVINHEAGHALGLNHANFWNTLGVSAIGDGANEEYGNTFDVMGRGSNFGAHYNVATKTFLGWLPASGLHTVTTSGDYRIYAFDQPVLEQSRQYGIKVVRDAERTYNLQYNRHYGNALLQNRASLIWNWSGQSNAGQWIDTTPGTGSVGNAESKADGGIEVGRTFSDPAADIHFTVLGRNELTVPPSLDVAVRLGAFVGNSAPSLTLTSSAIAAVATNTAVTFTATAADADGDALAYHWECGDGFHSRNTASFSRSFPTAGQYTMMCTVSDMKGSTVRKHVTLDVGNVTNRRRIVGIITAGGIGLPGVLVKVGTNLQTYTDSSGAYTLSNSTATSQTVTAQLYGYTLTPSAVMPVTVGVGQFTLDWTAVSRPILSIAPSGSPTEGGAAGSFTISRTGATTAALTVNALALGGTTTSADYSLTPGVTAGTNYDTFTIPAGSASITVTVAATNDAIPEGPETLIINLAESADYLMSLSAAKAVLSITDNDTTLPVISLSSTDVLALEGDTPDPASFVITRTGATTAALPVTLTYPGTATNGVDYTSLPATITIPAGQSSVTTSLVLLNDSTTEGYETVTPSISANAAYLVATAQSILLQVEDDDIAKVSVTSPDALSLEAGRDPGMFLIVRTGSTAAPLTIYYGVQGAALHGTDYIALPTQITMPAGLDRVAIMVSPYDDAHGEPDEDVTLRLTTFGGTYLVDTAASTATVTIRDNADLPLVTLTGMDNIIGEPTDAGAFRVTATGSILGNITVKYSVSGTATSGLDYTALTGTVSISSNGTNNTATIPITALDDAFLENAESITLTLLPDPAYTIYNDGIATTWIRDNEAPTLNVSRNSTVLTETAASYFTIGRTNSLGVVLAAGDLVVSFTMSGTALNGTDYTTVTTTATIPDGASFVDIPITPTNDTIMEGTESVIITLNSAATYSIMSGSATLLMADNETTSPTIAFGTGAVTTSETPDAVTGVYREFNVNLSAAAANPASIEIVPASRSGSSTVNTAWGDGIDYAIVDPITNTIIPKATLNYVAGVTSQKLKLLIVNDAVIEGQEMATFALINPVGIRLSGSVADKLNVAINDDLAAAPAPRLSILNPTATQSETQAAAPPVIVVMDQVAANAVTVNYTATGTATAGSDYTLPASPLTFPVGETIRSFTPTLINDTAFEPNESLIITLTTASGGGLFGNVAHTLTLTSDDLAPPVELWRQLQFPTTWSDPLIAGNTADPDKDGLMNMEEYALGSDPNASEPSLLPSASGNATTMSLTYRKNVTATDMIIGARTGSDLGGWSTAGITETLLGTTGNIQTLRATIDKTAATRQFLKVLISPN